MFVPIIVGVLFVVAVIVLFQVKKKRHNKDIHID